MGTNTAEVKQESEVSTPLPRRVADIFPGKRIDDSRCVAYFGEVWAFAERTQQVESLRRAIDRVALDMYFGRKAFLRLFKDFAPYSFAFAIFTLDADGIHEECQMNGGIIYNGAMCPTPTSGWSVHT